jgi:hypothetical protein
MCIIAILPSLRGNYMSKITLDLPETLHAQLKQQAKSEGISLNQYIIYALTRQATLGYQIQLIPDTLAEQQKTQFSKLRDDLGHASDAEIAQILAERESVKPEAGLSPEVVARLQERVAGKFPRTSDREP